MSEGAGRTTGAYRFSKSETEKPEEAKKEGCCAGRSCTLEDNRSWLTIALSVIAVVGSLVAAIATGGLFGIGISLALLKAVCITTKFAMAVTFISAAAVALISAIATIIINCCCNCCDTKEEDKKQKDGELSRNGSVDSRRDTPAVSRGNSDASVDSDDGETEPAPAQTQTQQSKTGGRYKMATR